MHFGPGDTMLFFDIPAVNTLVGKTYLFFHHIVYDDSVIDVLVGPDHFLSQTQTQTQSIQLARNFLFYKLFLRLDVF